MKFLKILIVPMLVVALAGCATKQQGGTLLGAGLGGLLGSQFGSGRGKLVGVAIGVLAGAMIGGEIGKSLDRADQLVAQSNTQYALERIPNGHRGPVWQNPDRRTSGYTVPTKTYQIRCDCRWTRTKSLWKSLPSNRWFLENCQQISVKKIHHIPSIWKLYSCGLGYKCIWNVYTKA